MVFNFKLRYLLILTFFQLFCADIQNPLTDPDNVSISVICSDSAKVEMSDSIGLCMKLTSLIDSVSLKFDTIDTLFKINNSYDHIDTMWINHSWSEAKEHKVYAMCYYSGSVKYDSASVKVTSSSLEREYATISLIVPDSIVSGTVDSIGLAVNKKSLLSNVILTISEKDSTLNLNSLNENDTLWIRRVWNRSDTLMNIVYHTNESNISIAKQLNIYEPGAPPRISATDQIAVVGSPCTLSVEVISETPLTFSWVKEGEMIAGKTNELIAINSVTMSDTGIYKCIAENEFGIDSIEIRLTVTELSPQITDEPEVGFQNGDTLKFTISLTDQEVFDSINIAVNNPEGETTDFLFQIPNDDGIQIVYTLELTGVYTLTASAFSINGTQWQHSKIINVNEKIPNSDLLTPQPNSFECLEDSSVIITFEDLLSNDSNETKHPDTDLAITVSKQPDNGTCSIEADSDYGRNITYRPDPNFYGPDTFYYRITLQDSIASSTTAPVIINVTGINDSPCFEPGENVTVNSDSGVYTYRGWARNIQSGPENESDQKLTFSLKTDNDEVFSVFPAIDPQSGDLTFTPVPRSQGTVNVTVSLTDDGGIEHGGVDSAESITFTTTLYKTNNAPEFISPSVDAANIEVNEGQTKSITIAFTDSDGTTPVLSSLHLPSWAEIIETEGSHQLKLSPHYDLTSNSNPILITDMVLKLTDEIDDDLFTLLTLNITVSNKNRSPEFNVVPSDTQIQIGSYYEADLIFPENDLDGDLLTFTFVSKPDNMTYNSSTGKIEWFVDRNINTPNSSRNVEVRLTDRYDTTNYSWNIDILTHTWNYRHFNSDYISSAPKIFARDSSHLLLVWKPNTEGFKESNDGGVSWDQASFSLERYYHTPYIGSAKFIDDYLYLICTWDGPLSNIINVYKISNSHIDTLFHIRNYGAGAGSISSYSKKFYFGARRYNSPYNYLIDMDIHDSLLNVSSPIQVLQATSEGNIFAISDSAIYRKSESEANTWSRVNFLTKKPVQIETDKQFGSILYIIDKTGESYTLQKSTTGLSSNITFSPLTLTPQITPHHICMLSGTTGWVVCGSGDVYFTNDGFKTIHKEIFRNEQGEDISIEKLILADDNKSVFAYGNGTVFRY